MPPALPQAAILRVAKTTSYFWRFFSLHCSLAAKGAWTISANSQLVQEDAHLLASFFPFPKDQLPQGKWGDLVPWSTHSSCPVLPAPRELCLQLSPFHLPLWGSQAICDPDSLGLNRSSLPSATRKSSPPGGLSQGEVAANWTMSGALARPTGGLAIDKALEDQPSWRGVGFPLSPEKVVANQLQNGSCGATWGGVRGHLDLSFPEPSWDLEGIHPLVGGACDHHCPNSYFQGAVPGLGAYLKVSDLAQARAQGGPRSPPASSYR